MIVNEHICRCILTSKLHICGRIRVWKCTHLLGFLCVKMYTFNRIFMCENVHIYRGFHVWKCIHLLGFLFVKIYTFTGIFMTSLNIIFLIARPNKLQRSGIQLSERLASLGIMVAQLRPPLTLQRTLQHYGIERFQVGPQLGTH